MKTKRFTDLELKEKVKKQQKEYFQKNKEIIYQKRKERFENLPEEEKNKIRKMKNDFAKQYYKEKKLLKTN